MRFTDEDDGIKLLIGLSAADSDSHIGAIQALSELLCEEDVLAALLAAKSEKELADIIARAWYSRFTGILIWNTSLLVQGPGFWGIFDRDGHSQYRLLLHGVLSLRIYSNRMDAK